MRSSLLASGHLATDIEAMRLPGWVTDDHSSIEREAAPYRGMTSAERMQFLAELCRGAAKQLSFRPDAARLLDYQDPLPESTRSALARLRRASS